MLWGEVARETELYEEAIRLVAPESEPHTTDDWQQAMVRLNPGQAYEADCANWTSMMFTLAARAGRHDLTDTWTDRFLEDCRLMRAVDVTASTMAWRSRLRTIED